MLRHTGELLEANVVKILTDTSCNMKVVYVNDKLVMQGNADDFYNGCHGFYDIQDFGSANTLAAHLAHFIKAQGKEVEIVREPYRFH
nr:hypothetical protein [Jeotgalibacillus malaysiensis]